MSDNRTRHGLQRLARSARRITRRAFGQRGFFEARVLTDWPEIVGPDLAAESVPESLGGDGRLRIRVAGARALELQHLEPQLIERIATYFGYRAVRRIVIVQGPLPPRAPARAPSARELSADEERRLAGRLAPMADGGLRAALARLGRAILARERPEDTPNGEEP